MSTTSIMQDVPGTLSLVAEADCTDIYPIYTCLRHLGHYLNLHILAFPADEETGPGYLICPECFLDEVDVLPEEAVVEPRR